MVNKKYKVVKSRVYYGEVIVPGEFGIKNNGKRTVREYRPLRHMLFEMTEDGLGIDLLNKSDNYKVFGINDDCKIGEYTLFNIIHLEDVLDYLGYLDELGYKDIKNIRDEIFSGHFISDNPELLTSFRDCMGESLSIMDSYYLRRLFELRKKTFSEAFFSGSRMDQFKETFEEKKKRLMRN